MKRISLSKFSDYTKNIFVDVKEVFLTLAFLGIYILEQKVLT